MTHGQARVKARDVLSQNLDENNILKKVQTAVQLVVL